jgi:hypothetical protein
MQAGLRMGANCRLREVKNIPAKIVPVWCECQLRCRLSRFNRIGRLDSLP